MKRKKLHPWWSVMLLYPESECESGQDTYYDFVRAPERDAAAEAAITKCLKANEWDADDQDLRGGFETVLVLKGRHKGV
jgi:hypothetical protein